MPVLSADHPRSDPRDDLLGYAPFAKMLAHSVLRGSPAAGLVVGIYGEWGLGKTTLLNFIEHFVINDAGDDAPVIVRFNPWWFSGREDLLRRFFKEFESAVLKSRARDTRLREALQKFGDAIGNVPFAWVAGMGKLMAAATKLGQPVDVVGMKQALSAALTAEPLRVVVLIDDIDRLLPSEMIDVFRLVRSVGDFPNVHYLLAFDREVVCDAISAEGKTHGPRYLEKIIQVPFELPRPDPGKLQAVFLRRLDEILSVTDPRLVDSDRWSDVFLHGIAPFLRTPRDAVRLLNALGALYPSVVNEVSPTDLVAIEAIRVFAPEAYDVLRSHRERFVGMWAAAKHFETENRQFHETWLSKVKSKPEVVKALVIRLFPSVASILGATSGVRNDASFRNARRICAEQVFDVYFRYSLERGTSRSDFLALLEVPREELARVLESFSAEHLDGGRSKLRWFIDMLWDDLSAGQRSQRSDLLEVMCQVGDKIIATAPRSFTFDVPADLLLVFVIEKLLERRPVDERCAALTAAIETAGVSTAARIVTVLGAQHGRYGQEASPPDERTIRVATEVDALENIVRRRIETSAADGNLWLAPDLLRVLFDWRRLGGEREMRDAVRDWIRNDVNLLTLLESVTNTTSAGRWHIDLGAAEILLDLEEAAARAKVMAASGSAERSRIVAQAFIDAYSATEPQRRQRATERRVLTAILQESVNGSAFPSKHKIRTQFESERTTIDQLEKDNLLFTYNHTLYVVTVAGLQRIQDMPLAARELRACAVVLRDVQNAYRSDVSAKVTFEDVVRRAAEEREQFTAVDLGRAAFSLQRFADAAGVGMSLEINQTTGIPTAASGSDRLLDVDPWSFSPPKT